MNTNSNPLVGRYRFINQSPPGIIEPNKTRWEINITENKFKELLIQTNKELNDTVITAYAFKHLKSDLYALTWERPKRPKPNKMKNEIGGKFPAVEISGQNRVNYKKLLVSGDTLSVKDCFLLFGKHSGIHGEWKSINLYQRAGGGSTEETTSVVISNTSFKTILSMIKDTTIYDAKIHGDTIIASEKINDTGQELRWSAKKFGDTLQLTPLFSPSKYIKLD